MKLLLILVAFVMSFSSTSVVAQVVPATVTSKAGLSLAEITGVQVSLMDAMAIALDRIPSTYTVREFRADVVAYAEFIGIPYYNALTNGYNNVAILHAASNGYFTRSNELSVATDTVVLAVSITSGVTKSGVYTEWVDSVGLSPFQKEYHVARGARLADFSTMSVEVNETSSEVAGSKSPEELKEGVINPSLAASGTDTTTLGGATTPILSTVEGFVSTYVNRVDTVTIVDTISSTEFCHCTEEVPMAELWAHYMGLRKLIRKEKNAGQRALLVGCRIKLGAIVRAAKRYEAPVATKTIGAVEYRSVPAEWCDQRTVYHIMPKVSLVANKSAGGSSGVAKARWKGFWRGVARFFDSIGSCGRASH